VCSQNALLVKYYICTNSEILVLGKMLCWILYSGIVTKNTLYVIQKAKNNLIGFPLFHFYKMDCVLLGLWWLNMINIEERSCRYRLVLSVINHLFIIYSPGRIRVLSAAGCDRFWLDIWYHDLIITLYL